MLQGGKWAGICNRFFLYVSYPDAPPAERPRKDGAATLSLDVAPGLGLGVSGMTSQAKAGPRGPGAEGTPLGVLESNGVH